MERISIRFPSGRIYRIRQELKAGENDPTMVFFFSDLAGLKRYFRLDAELSDDRTVCLYLHPSAEGHKQFALSEGGYYAVYAPVKAFWSSIEESIKSAGVRLDNPLSWLILSEARGRKADAIEVPVEFCAVFSNPCGDTMIPVSYTPFTYSRIHLPEAAAGDVLSFGADARFTMAHAAGNTLTVSPCDGPLSDAQEIDEMDHMVGAVMGHTEARKVTAVHDYSSYSLVTNYSRRFPHQRKVNHIFSHMACAMFDNGFTTDTGIGIIMDTYSTDEAGNGVGGELVYGKLGDMRVTGGWQPVPLPGGDISNLEPWRISLAALRETHKADMAKLELPLVKAIAGNPSQKYLFDAIRYGNMNFTLTSSMHHILSALGEMIDFESSTPSTDFFESRLDALFTGPRESGTYNLPLVQDKDSGISRIDTYRLFDLVAQDIIKGMNKNLIVYRMVQSIAQATASQALELSRRLKEKKVFLSGEFFKQAHFVELFRAELEKAGLRVFTHRTIPVDDSAVSVGQALYQLYEPRTAD